MDSFKNLIVSYPRMIVRMSRSIMMCEDEVCITIFKQQTGSINICEYNLTHALTFIDLWIGISEVLLDNQLQLTKIQRFKFTAVEQHQKKCFFPHSHRVILRNQ